MILMPAAINAARSSAPPEMIREVKFIETETGELQILAFLNDGSTKFIHLFTPANEIWRQFEFDGLTLPQAEELIAARQAVLPKA